MITGSDCWKIESFKYDGKIHRTWTCALPLEPLSINRDEFNPDFMMTIPAHSTVLEANGKEWSSPYDVVACFYEGKHYQVMVLRKDNDNEYYCNSCTIAKISEQDKTVSFIDMDLDLLVDKMRKLRVVDQREFEVNSRIYHYPEELKMNVKSDLSELKRQVRMQKGIFSNQYTFSAEHLNDN